MAWSGQASEHAAPYHCKMWSYTLIPRDEIAENWSLIGLLDRCAL